MEQPCSTNTFRYNDMLCACDPSHFLANGSCARFDARAKSWAIIFGVGPAPTFLTTVLPLDSIHQINRYQVMLLVATLAALVMWLTFYLAVRLEWVDDGATSGSSSVDGSPA